MEARRKKSLAQRGKPHPSMKGRRPWSAGSRLPMEVRAKISTTLIKTCNGPKIKEKMRVVQLKVQKTKPPTGLEIMVKNKLDDFGVRYERNKIFHDEGFGCVSDFYIPDRDLILEIDGCYWHGCVEPACVVGRRNLKIGLTPNQKRIIRRDEMKDTYYISKGHFVKRIWGHDVLSNCDETLRKAINDDIEVSIP
jgi:G:T-mismatch repair DNA endonuclease (very short patch repair protein)